MCSSMIDLRATVTLGADLQCVCRSFVELRKTSVVWNYKYADVEFGRLQARDLLQHLWTGPISNAPVDIVQVCSAAWKSCRVQVMFSSMARQDLGA